MMKAQFRRELPTDLWVAELSREFPGATFRLLAGLPAGETAIELGDVVADAVDPIIEAGKAHPAIGDFDLLYADEGRALSRYETTQTSLYSSMEDLSTPPEFPIVVENGYSEFEVTGTRSQIRAVDEALAGDRTHQILSVVESESSSALLTERQAELLEAAVRQGYFDVPRECTLADLAAAVGVDKSTASGVLRRGTERIVKWYLTGEGPGLDG